MNSKKVFVVMGLCLSVSFGIHAKDFDIFKRMDKCLNAVNKKSYGNALNDLQKVLDEGADTDMRNNSNLVPLQYMIDQLHEVCMKKQNAKDSSLEKIETKINHCFDVMRALCKAGADVNIILLDNNQNLKDYEHYLEGDIYLLGYVYFLFSGGAFYDERNRCAKLLLDYGANPKLADEHVQEFVKIQFGGDTDNGDTRQSNRNNSAVDNDAIDNGAIDNGAVDSSN